MKTLCLVIASWLLGIGLAIGQVNINTANLEELDSLPGIGAARAKAIIQYREQHGPFKSVQDLKNVPRFPEKLVGDLQGKVSVSGPSMGGSPIRTVEEKPARPPAKPATPAASEHPAVPTAPAVPVAKPAAPARPALPGKPPVAGQPAAAPTPPVAPARPAMPGKPAAEAKPAPAKPAAPPTASSASKPATPAAPASKPAMPVAPAKPAQPAAVN